MREILFLGIVVEKISFLYANNITIITRFWAYHNWGTFVGILFTYCAFLLCPLKNARDFPFGTLYYNYCKTLQFVVVLVEGALSTRIHKRAFWNQNVCITFFSFFIVIPKGTCCVSWPKNLNKTNPWIKCEIWFHNFNLSNLVLFPRCLCGIPLALEKCLNHLVSSRKCKD